MLAIVTHICHPIKINCPLFTSSSHAFPLSLQTLINWHHFFLYWYYFKQCDLHLWWYKRPGFPQLHCESDSHCLRDDTWLACCSRFYAGASECAIFYQLAWCEISPVSCPLHFWKVSGRHLLVSIWDSCSLPGLPPAAGPHILRSPHLSCCRWSNCRSFSVQLWSLIF